jgi:hypothetical protein
MHCWLQAGLEIRGSSAVPDYHFQGKDENVLTDDSPSDDLRFSHMIAL